MSCSVPGHELHGRGRLQVAMVPTTVSVFGSTTVMALSFSLEMNTRPLPWAAAGLRGREVVESAARASHPVQEFS